MTFGLLHLCAHIFTLYFAMMCQWLPSGPCQETTFQDWINFSPRTPATCRPHLSHLVPFAAPAARTSSAQSACAWPSGCWRGRKVRTPPVASGTEQHSEPHGPTGTGQRVAAVPVGRGEGEDGKGADVVGLVWLSGLRAIVQEERGRDFG